MDNENVVTNEIVADPAVKNAIIQKRAAKAELRKEDCKMLTRLKEVLAENIRLHGILSEIKAKIADTPTATSTSTTSRPMRFAAVRPV